MPVVIRISLHTAAYGHLSLPRFVRSLLVLLVLLFAACPAAAQGCANPRRAQERKICADPQAREMAAAIPVALRSLTTRLSAMEAGELAAGQRKWLEWLPLICSDHQTYDGPDIDCLRRELDKRLTALRALATVAASTPPACGLIAALANRGARALRSANLVGRDQTVNLRNDGHARTLVQLDQGTAHAPYLANAAGEKVEDAPFGANWDTIRWAYEIAVVRIAGRIWEVRWDIGTLDDTAVLSGATDGSAVCLFRHEWLRPTLKVLHDGQGSEAALYRALLLGSGREAPRVNLDSKAVATASDQGPYGNGAVSISGPAWRVDLLRSGKAMALVTLELSSGAGRGCVRDTLGLVQDGRVVAEGFGYPSDSPEASFIAPATPTFTRLTNLVFCEGSVQTPTLDRAGRAYVLVNNVTPYHEPIERIRLLAAARHGTMRALARLSWQVRNRATSAAGPAWKTVVRSP